MTDARLVKRLWEQGIPLTLIRWVASFLNDRTAALRLDGQTGDQEPVKIGVPQGSPSAPILFMLFTAPLFKILTKKEKKAGLSICGYVDDGLLTSRAQDEVLSTAKIQTVFTKIESWATENGMVFEQPNLKLYTSPESYYFPNRRLYYCRKNKFFHNWHCDMLATNPYFSRRFYKIVPRDRKRRLLVQSPSRSQSRALIVDLAQTILGNRSLLFHNVTMVIRWSHHPTLVAI